ncbi:hypothetical protein GCK72_013120 [Caenorhabditis remanei]|uniref:ATP-dependent DNA helicase n=1 Tax=Caenorhabditis remanei TaxID=31234 RepID=A0A6A5GQ61_CAERE|nr:hypothetical protein GCK72_013120 [Caenorhabditis remanei]KAF1756666.1 hypothetical protein GCK72_013120 [Caenorhabditis remanei]
MAGPPRSGIIDGIEDTQLMSQGSPSSDDMAGPPRSGIIDGIEDTQLMSQDSAALDDMAGPSRSGIIDGIEDTQLMSQNSVRKRDKKKQKRVVDATRIADKRKSETEEARELRLQKVAKQSSLRRSQERRQVRTNRVESMAKQMVSKRSQETSDEKELRNHSDKTSAAKRRSTESVEVKDKRRKTEAERQVAARSNASTAQTSARKEVDRVRKRKRSVVFLGIAATDDRPDTHYCGRMDKECTFCGAFYFKCETTTKGEFTACCMSGAVKIEQKNIPLALKKLFLTNKDSKDQNLWKESKNFIENIRQYNNSLAMACMKADVQMPTGGPYCYRIHKQVYHLIGDLHPGVGQPRNFAQVFIMDTEQAAAELAGRDMNSPCSKELFEKLISVLKENHPHAQSFQMMYEVENEEKEKAALEKRPERNITMTFETRSQDDHRRYQESTANEVAVVYVGDSDEIPGKRGTTVYQRSGNINSILLTDPNCDPMTYPLLFPTGQFGWHPNIDYTKSRGKRQRVTMREFYAYNLHVRKEFSPLFRSRKLFQQYVVDVWTRVEQNNLNFIRNNQSLLHVESLSGLQDYVVGEEKGPVGIRITLPASFTGSPRDMISKYQDSMAMVARLGKPDYFLTMTSNPKWAEIQECLFPGQVALDRPDLVTRVFDIKISEIREDLFKRRVLGDVSAYIYVIEFQKRGLPHMHMLIIMKPGSKPRTAADVDRIISAEIPNKDENPVLHELVTTLMMHRPCGVHNPKSPCMQKNGSCDKKFPKEFRDTTSTDHDGFSLYRRRDDGRCVEYQIDGQVVPLTNQSVVPYPPWFLTKYKCHINLEVCGAVSAVKYIFKYVYKGTTRACVLIRVVDGKETEVVDEIKHYLDTRFVCAPEAVHHLFKFPMSYRSCKVLHLAVHLPEDQNIIFQRGDEAQAVNRAQSRNTKLTAWFSINKKCQEAVLPDGSLPPTLKDSRQYFYHEMPEHFTFNTSTTTWQPRKTMETSLGRMYFISPKNRERYALRQLLLYTKGATSFDDLHTVQGKKLDTFVEAARASGYLSDDTMYEQTLSEAAGFHSAAQLRGLFVMLLLFENINNPEELWNKFLKDLSEDFEHQGYTPKEAESLAYHDMKDRMEAMNGDIRQWINKDYQPVASATHFVDLKECEKKGEEMKSLLNVEQSEAVEAILDALDFGGLFFIDGPGGSGKTFVYNCLANIIMGKGKTILPMAWVGIAAALLPNGRTVASICKLNINDFCKSSTMKPNSALAKVLASVSMILWDEAPMSPKAALETVDKLFREITGNDEPFGGKVVVLGGDFRQVLPVVDNGRADDQIANCIKKSFLWNEFKVFHLKTNMRLTGDALDWKNELLDIGDGKVGAPVTGEMPIPDGLESHGDLAEEVFGDLLASGDVNQLAKVAILTPRNKEALEVNNSVLDKMPGELRSYTSLDEITHKDGGEINDSLNFTTELLNQMTPSGMPPHLLRLKKGAIVMLLRNLDVKNSLCNGTRLVVDDMGARVLQCKFINGPRQGQMVFIPKIELNYEKGLPFIMSRLQFPIRLSFAMTINKSQGQTFEKIGLKSTPRQLNPPRHHYNFADISRISDYREDFLGGRGPTFVGDSSSYNNDNGTNSLSNRSSGHPAQYDLSDISLEIENPRENEYRNNGETSQENMHRTYTVEPANTTDNPTTNHNSLYYDVEEENRADVNENSSSRRVTTADMENTKRIQSSSFPKSWILKNDPNSTLKNNALQQLQLCQPQKKERLTTDTIQLGTNSSNPMTFFYRNFRDLIGNPYPVDFGPTNGWPKMRYYNIVAIGASTFPHTWLLLQDRNCHEIRYLTKVNVPNWRKFLTEDDEQNDEE